MHFHALNKSIAAIVGSLLIAIISYCVIAVILYLVSIFALLSGVIIKAPVLFDYQKSYYFDGARNIFQYDPQCIEADKHLIYKPKLGTCKFSNAEFQTHIHFDAEGRLVPARHKNIQSDTKGIAIIGDSYAMGWGVNDEKTFANILQQQINKPVYNLGVSSYGTERELKSLEQSPIANKVDTVVIQYCDNDLGENFKNPEDMYATEVVQEYARVLAEGGARRHFYSGIYGAFKKNIKRALTIPYTAVFTSNLAYEPIDFEPHFQSIKMVLKRHESYLRDKKVVIFYLNEHGRLFKNYPQELFIGAQKVFFLDPVIHRQDFYPIDGHLNELGNKSIGMQLATFLKKVD